MYLIHVQKLFILPLKTVRVQWKQRFVICLLREWQKALERRRVRQHNKRRDFANSLFSELHQNSTKAKHEAKYWRADSFRS